MVFWNDCFDRLCVSFFNLISGEKPKDSFFPLIITVTKVPTGSVSTEIMSY